MTRLIALAVDYWWAGLIAATIGSGTVAYYSWKGQVEAEAVAEVRLEQFEAADAARATAEAALARADSQAVLDAKRFAQMRAKADSLARIAEREAREATVRLAAAGDSLDATLDSLYAVVPTHLEPLARTALRQHREEQAAQRDVADALRGQVRSLRTSLALADSTSMVWRTRYTSLEAAYSARGRALEAAREAVQAQVQASGSSFLSDALKVGGGLAAGYALAQAF